MRPILAGARADPGGSPRAPRRGRLRRIERGQPLASARRPRRRARARGGRPRTATRTRAPARLPSARQRAARSPRRSQEAQAPVEERVHGDLVGGVEHARRRAARARGLAGQAQARERVEVDRLEGQLADRREVERRDRQRRRSRRRAARRRSRCACPAGRGARASRRRPAGSRPWTSDCGCTTTSIRSYGVPNRWWASISSRPLFISVAESIVILPPIAQVGCASACSTVTSSQLARACARGTGRRWR